MTIAVYLDSSTISKRYIVEKGTETVDLIFDRCEIEKTLIFLSIWNIGEVLGVFDKYYNRKKITFEMFEECRKKLIIEIQKLNKLKMLKILPVNSHILSKAYPYIFKYHIYQADAIQISSFDIANCEIFVSADKKLIEILKSKKIMAFNIELEESLIKSQIEHK